MTKTIHIAGASGYWGESAMATPQLLAAHKSGDIHLDYIVYDYLAEITMSILARAKAKSPETGGYARDFVEAVIKPYAKDIADTGIKFIANAGPTDMFSDAPFPDPQTIASINAYLGAFPIAKALAAGADIIITGRVVDSAVTLGACIHEFGWGEQAWDKLASGSLCGHILECGPQVTGGNFTDWEQAGDVSNIGYPIAEICEDGSFVTTKPPGTAGIVNIGTVSEQMLYEIGDPQAYILPDVICDFSDVTITQIGPNRVEISPAKGRPAPTHYKTCLTHRDGYRAGLYLTFIGHRAADKAKAFGAAAIKRAENRLRASNLGGFTEVSIEIIGDGSQMGQPSSSTDVIMKIAVKHAEAAGVGIFLKELNGTYLATPPGLSAFTGAGRPKPSPVVRLFSYLTPKTDIRISIDAEGMVTHHMDKIFDPLHRLGDIFAGFLEDGAAIERFYLPGSHAMNIVLDRALGGGGAASLRNDAQGKGFAQILLAQTIQITAELAEALRP